MSGAAIQLRELAFRRPGGFALEIPALRVEPGARLACVGPSGAGKSTFLELLAGILTPASGSLEVDGVELVGTSDAERRRLRLTRMGLVFQELELLEHLSVRDNALLPWLLVPTDGLDERRAELERVAGELGIGRLLDRRPRSLSHGERQRVALCRALVGAPRLVLADEPTGNLDAEATRRALELVLREVGELGATLIFVTHDRDLLPSFDDVLDVTRWTGGAR